MKIKVKLFATLRENKESSYLMELEEGALVTDVLKALALEESQVAIVMINGRSKEFDEPLKDKDQVAFFPPVGGG